jgi:hypothetical protein
MKTLPIIAVLILLSMAAVAFTQERPRYYYDNFDTLRGVQVHVEAQPNVSRSPQKKTPPRTNRSSSRQHYLPSPPYGETYKALVAPGPGPVSEGELVKRTAMVTMRVTDGYAQRTAGPFDRGERLTMSGRSHLKGHSTGDSMLDTFIVDSSQRYGIDPLLIYAQMNQESSFKLRATSYKGASGLMQLMPATARRLGVTDIYDPRQNIEGGVKYMRMLLDMFGGDIALALAGYNAGEGAVMKYGNQIPPYNETQDYVRRISSRYKVLSGQSSVRYVPPTGDPQAARFQQKAVGSETRVLRP